MTLKLILLMIGIGSISNLYAELALDEEFVPCPNINFNANAGSEFEPVEAYGDTRIKISPPSSFQNWFIIKPHFFNLYSINAFMNDRDGARIQINYNTNGRPQPFYWVKSLTCLIRMESTNYTQSESGGMLGGEQKVYLTKTLKSPRVCRHDANGVYMGKGFYCKKPIAAPDDR